MKRKIDNRTIEPVCALGIPKLTYAIVMQACEDYFTCRRTLLKGKNVWGKISDCETTLRECISFFYSDWYKVLTNNRQELSAEHVITRLEEMVADTKTYPKDYKPFKYNEEDAYEEDDDEDADN